MLSCRDAVADEVEVAGSLPLFAALDEIDARFAEVTVALAADSAFSSAGSGWWRGRLPAAPEALDYLFRP